MFNYLPNKEKYIDFADEKYLKRSTYRSVEEVPHDLWFAFNKIEVYVDGSVEIIGASFLNPHKTKDILYIGEFTDGSATVEFRGQHSYFHTFEGEPLLQWEGVLSNGDVIKYESSKSLREEYARLLTGTDFDEYDKSPAVNTWLARSWIDGGEEELFFLVESKQMVDDVASYYNLPVPYDSDLASILTNDLQSIRFKSVWFKAALKNLAVHNGEGDWTPVVVAGIVFKDNVATKFRLYKTSRE